MSGSQQVAGFLLQLYSFVLLQAIAENEESVLDPLLKSSVSLVKCFPDPCSILKIMRRNLCMPAEYFVYCQPDREDILIKTELDIVQNQFLSWHTSGMTYAQDFSTFFIRSG